MSKNLLGIVTFGNTMFSIKAIESCLETTLNHLDVFVVVGKPDDHQTVEYLKQKEIPHVIHDMNKGFPASVNDIYDYGFKEHDYDHIIFAGNDIVAYPFAIDNLIKSAEKLNYDAISSEEVNVKDIVNFFPSTRQFYTGPNYVTNDLSHASWALYQGYTKDIVLTNGEGIIDIHNLCLYKRSVFEKVGYIDVNFYPAYFEDNDYVQRISKTNLKTATINSKYFHFWSRTIHQGSGGSTGKFFGLNQAYYIEKWGGVPHHETYDLPFNGKPYTLVPNLDVPPDINIQRRDLESHFINYWKNR